MKKKRRVKKIKQLGELMASLEKGKDSIRTILLFLAFCVCVLVFILTDKDILSESVLLRTIFQFVTGRNTS